METLIEFFSFESYNVWIVTLGTVLLGCGSAIVGCFTFLRKRALVGDVVAHSILPGVCLGFMVLHAENSATTAIGNFFSEHLPFIAENSFPLLLMGGAVLAGWLSLVTVDFISRNSKLKPDTAIGLVLSVFFGVGILLLTHIQHTNNAAQAGLDKFLFGKAASMTQQDVFIFSGIATFLIIVVFAFYKEFKLVSFNPDFAKVAGLPVKFLEFLLSTITILAVATGIQAVGVVLMAALLITPAAAARFWTTRLHVMIILATIFGAVSGLFGSFISYTAPAMPTGPWIVMCLSFFAIASAFLAPKKGELLRA